MPEMLAKHKSSATSDESLELKVGLPNFARIRNRPIRVSLTPTHRRA
jgi:hypothetical protein